MKETTTPEGAKELLSNLEEGDEIRISRADKVRNLRVLELTFNDRGTPFVRCLAPDEPGAGQPRIKPSSGYKGSCVVGHGQGMQPHYTRLQKLD